MNKNKNTLDFISTVPGFQYAINLNYDLKNPEKIERYIATTGAIDIMEDILLSLKANSTDRARLFVGPYGKGKSHLVLVLMALLYYRDNYVFNDLLREIKQYKPELFDLAFSVMNDDKKLLPVVVTGTTLSMTQSLLQSLNKTLKENDLFDIMPDTYFNAANDMIKLWETEYPDTFKNFTKSINTTAKEFSNQLKEFNQTVYNEFVNIYPKLTSGAQFNPLQGIDVVDLYSDVVIKLKDKGYKGIYIVYDEFSKFLEGNIDGNSAMDIKLLQDFAEKCNRSGENQLHILLISHKSISNYVDKLPKQKIDAWRAVENRFKTIEINYLETQTYEIISHVILKDKEKWKHFYDENRNAFNQLTLQASRSGIFNGIGEMLEESVVYGTYPMHPISTFILPKISERVAQNERTIFTFLSSNEISTLGYFIHYEKSDFPLLTPDYIYNYFETLFKKENYKSEIYRVWRDTATALRKLDDSENLASAILKTLGLIYILGDFQKLPPTIELIKLIYFNIDVEAVIEKLIDKKILYHVKSKGHLKFLEATDIDINELVENTIVKRSQTFSSKNSLNQLSCDHYLYATGYNDEYEITRYFDFEFIELKELYETTNWNKRIQKKKSDGTVFSIIIGSNDSFYEAKQRLKEINHNRLLFILPKKSYNIDDLLRQYDAIEFLIGKNNHEDHDKLLNEELNVYLDDIKHQLYNYINIFIRPELGEAVYYYKGELHKISRKSNLTRLLSKICEDVYSDTPVVNNEIINKNELTPTALSSRRKVIDALLTSNIVPFLGLSGYGLDVSIMQSTLISKGILIENSERAYLCTQGLEPRLQNVLNIIQEFILNTSKEGPQAFNNLYHVLTGTDRRIGLRRGIIPIYLAVILHQHKRHIIIVRNGQELEVNGQLLDDINEKPQDYEIYLEDWNEAKESYIQSLVEMFNANSNEKEYNTFDYVFKAIHRWFYDLPKYAMNYTEKYLGNGEFIKVDKKISQLRNSLKGTRINSREFLFRKLPQIFAYKEQDKKIAKDLKMLKNELDSIKLHLMDTLAEDIRLIYGKNDAKNASLKSILIDWYESLEEYTKLNLYGHGEDSFLKAIGAISNNHYEFIESIAKSITGLRLEDWDDHVVLKFYNKMLEFKNNIEGYNNELKQRDQDEFEDSLYKITFVTDGTEITKSFVKREVSKEAKVLFNELEALLGDYSNLEKNEKRQILLEIFEKCC